MSKISEQEMNIEQKYISNVLEVLRSEYSKLEKQFDVKSNYLKDYRRYLWENRRDFNNLFEIAEYEDRLREDIRSYEVISSRIKILEKALDRPYFARIDFLEDGLVKSEKVYIGLTSVINKEKFDVLVMDWRAPIASMYYDFELGKAFYHAPDGKIEGEIELKRQFKIKNGNLLLAVDTGIKIDDLLLLETLEKSSNTKMQEIVYTIQKEQNQIIRHNESQSIWIQGVAGSGKTSVALHRIAYLLYHNRKRISAENIAVFSPHPVFIDYISDVLPELGEENAIQLTFYDLAQSLLEKYNLEIKEVNDVPDYTSTRLNTIKYKTSMNFLEVLNKYIKYLETKRWEFKDVYFANTKVFTAKQAEKLFNEEYAHIPINKRLEQVVNRITYLISMNYKKVNERKLKIAIYENAPDFDSLQLYKDLYTDISLWPKIGVKELPMEFAKICLETLSSIENGELYYEDVAPLLLLKSKMEGINKSNRFLHIVIDEIQTYSFIQIMLLEELFDKATFTYLGDVHQKFGAHDMWEMSDVKEFFLDSIEYFSLNKCYRSTAEIANLAKSVLPESNMEIVERNGEKPKYILSENHIDSLNYHLENLLRKEHETIAIIVNNESSAYNLEKDLVFDNTKVVTGATRKLIKGINIMPAYMVKGLEFDAVVIINTDDLVSENNLAYTLITRALHDLAIISTRVVEIFDNAIDEGLLDVINWGEINV